MNNVINHESLNQIVKYDEKFEIRCLNFVNKNRFPKQFFCENIDDYLKILDNLIQLNNNNYNIYIAPNRADYMLLDDLTIDNLNKLIDEISIFYAIETSSQNYQAIIKFAKKMNKADYETLSKYLKFRFQADKASASDVEHIHRLANFINKKAKYINTNTFFRVRYLSNISSTTVNALKQNVLSIMSKSDEKFLKYENELLIKKQKADKLNVDELKELHNYKNNNEVDKYVQILHDGNLKSVESGKIKSLSELDFLIFRYCKKRNYKFEEIAAALVKVRKEKIELKHYRPLSYLKRTYSNA
jgi:hypothetical protein